MFFLTSRGQLSAGEVLFQLDLIQLVRLEDMRHWKNSLNDTTIMQSLAYGPLDKSKQRWEKMFTGTRRRQWSSLWCSPRSGTRASRGEGSRTWRLRSPRPGNTMQSRSWSIDNTLKISIVLQLCSWPISLMVTLIDIVVLIVMMDGHSHVEYSDRNSSKYKETNCKVDWQADLNDKWPKYEATHCKGDQVEPNTGGDHSPRLHPWS